MPWMWKEDDGTVTDKELSPAQARNYLTDNGVTLYDKFEFEDGVKKRVKGMKQELETTQAKLTELEADNETLQEKVKRPAKDALNDYLPKKEHDELMKQKDKLIGDKDTEIGGYKNKMIEKAIYEAAAQGNAVDPDLVVAILQKEMKFDEDGTIRPFNGDDKILNKDKGEGYHDVSSYVKGYLGRKDKAYLVKSSGNAGAESKPGTQGGRQGNTTQYSRDELADLPMEQFAKLDSGAIHL